MNNFSVKIFINGDYIDFTKYAVFPFKMANMLDEQLDEAHIELKNVPDSYPYFKPFTKVLIRLNSLSGCKADEKMMLELYRKWGDNPNAPFVAIENGRIKESVAFDYIIANDRSLAIQHPNKRFFDHQIYLIEPTKIMERYIGDSLTFTNSLGNDYLSVKSFARADWDTSIVVSGQLPIEYKGSNASTIVKATYQTGEIELPISDEIYDQEKGFVIDSNKIVNKKEFLGVYKGETLVSGSTLPTLGPGTYTVKYKFTGSQATAISSTFLTTNVTYYFSAVENRYPLKKYTIADVINRIFDTIEPIEVNETPRFKLDKEWQKRLDKIIAPEFIFTKMTLREMLQMIGGHIHAEPRITGYLNKQYIVGFQPYGDNKYSPIIELPHITATFGVDINQNCTDIDSSASNVVNSLSPFQGVVVEPFKNSNAGIAEKSISLRTDTTTARYAEDNSTYIPTAMAIHIAGEDKKLLVNFRGKEYDITPYLFEKADYDLLSSYDGEFPYTKAYALYYTKGEKNIRGLFFRNENAISTIFTHYAIVNILRAVTGDNTIEFGNNKDIFELSFSITYLPVYSVRLKSYKQYVGDYDESVTLAYNQGANSVETRYYGENLKGVVERLGNVEKTYTYSLPFIMMIPPIGVKVKDSDGEIYYISNVSSEFLPNSIQCTIILSKKFNRLSQYVSINSQKRMWEISEKEAFERQSVWTDYVVLSRGYNKAGVYDTDFKAKTAEWFLLKKPKSGGSNIDYSVSAVTISRATKKGADIPPYLTLPVISSAMGNAMTFTYSFADNYSAGQKAQYVVGKNYSGYWGAYVPYCDYYGRFYTIHSELRFNNRLLNKGGYATPQSLPQGITDKNDNLFLSSGNIKYRKDSREIPQITQEIAVVTDEKDLIIGSALCSNCRAVNHKPEIMEFCYLPNELNSIDSKVDLTGAKIVYGALDTTGVVPIPVTGRTFNLPPVGKEDAKNYKAWAVVTKPTKETIVVEDEDGNVTTQTINKGGILAFGSNNLKETTEVENIFFNYVKNVKDFLDNKN